MKSLCVALLGIVCLATSVHADVITTPSGLSVGEQYRLVFVTVSTTNATSGTIGDYNTFVQTDAAGNAQLAALGTSWRAIGSTNDEDARDNTQTNSGVDGTGVPIYNLQGQRIAGTYVDLWDGDIERAILYDRDGNSTSTYVWTGTNPDGTASVNYLGNPTLCVIGDPIGAITGWVNLASVPPDAFRPLYAMSDVLTTAPEPGTLGFLGLGFIALVRWARRRRDAS